MEFTSEQKLVRFFGRNPDISRDFDFNDLKSVYSFIKRVDGDTVFTYHKDIKDIVIISALMRWGRYDNIKIMNAYSLLDIFFDKSEEFISVLDINVPILCIYLGYGEVGNIKQEDLIIQAFENQRRRGHISWLLYKGSSTFSKYPVLYKYLKDNGFKIIDIPDNIIKGEYRKDLDSVTIEDF